MENYLLKASFKNGSIFILMGIPLLFFIVLYPANLSLMRAYVLQASVLKDGNQLWIFFFETVDILTYKKCK